MKELQLVAAFELLNYEKLSPTSTENHKLDYKCTKKAMTDASINCLCYGLKVSANDKHTSSVYQEKSFEPIKIL